MVREREQQGHVPSAPWHQLKYYQFPASQAIYNNIPPACMYVITKTTMAVGESISNEVCHYQQQLYCHGSKLLLALSLSPSNRNLAYYEYNHYFSLQQRATFQWKLVPAAVDS